MTTTVEVTDYTRETAPMLLNRPRAETLLRQAGLQAVIATSPENVAYLSSYQCLTHWLNKGTPVFALLATDTSIPAYVVAPALEIDGWAEVPPPFGEIRLYGTSSQAIGREVSGDVDDLQPDDRFIFEHAFRDQAHPGALEVLAATLRELGLTGARIGLDESGIGYATRQRIMSQLGGTEVVDAAAVLRRIRMVKTAAEIERLTGAAETAARSLEATMTLAQPGMTERELFDQYNMRVAQRGGVPTFACINAGRRSAHPHPIPSDYRLRKGDLVKYDVGGTNGYYHSDIARIQVLGGANAAQRKDYEAILAGEQAGIAALRPGARPSEVFRAAVEAVRKSGLPNYRRHHTGHGIGIELYDPPLMQPATSSSELSGIGATDDPLEEGMVVNIETPYYVLGKHGMNVEDTLVITANGARPLFQLSRDLA